MALPEDVYDVLDLLVTGLTRSGALSEVLHDAARGVIEKADPKLEAKRKAQAEAAAQASADYAEFQQWQQFKAAAAQGQASAAEPAPAVGGLAAVPVVPGG
jgi:hypothetical protein